MRRIRFSIPLVAVIALLALVVGVVAGRVTSTGSKASGGGDGGRTAGSRIDVIIKASDSSFWQSMLAGARRAGGDFGVTVSLFGPTSETDVAQQVQLVENSISRGVDGIVLAPNSSTALDNVIGRARSGGIKVITVDTQVGAAVDGFIGTDNTKAAEQAGVRLCELARAGGRETGDVLIESSVAGVQVLTDREAGFRTGLAACPGLRAIGPRYNNNDINTAASQVNDTITANPNLVAVFAANNTSGDGTARAIRDNRAADRIPVVSFDTDPQQVAALGDGTIDVLVVQNPYFFGYQGVVAAGMAAVGSSPPHALDPGAVLASRQNMADPTVKALLTPPTAQAGK